MVKISPGQNILLKLIFWHFFDMPKEILRGWKNFLKFNLEYFSVPLLLKTYFSHWHGYSWSYGRGFDLGRWTEAFFSNLISRSLGAFLRTFLIIFGLIAETILFFLGLIFLLIWLFLPFIFLIGIFYGIKFLS
jgi:hypothetical protein